MPWLPKCIPPKFKFSIASLDPKSRSSSCPPMREPNQFSSSPKFCRSKLYHSPHHPLHNLPDLLHIGVLLQDPIQSVSQLLGLPNRTWALHMCATLEDYLCSMYEIVNFKKTMLHFVLFHNVTCSTNSLLSCIQFNTKKLHNITCTLVATSVILHNLECIF